MGIYIKDRGVDSMYIQGLPVISVWTQGRKIWPEHIEPIIDQIFSCFFNGYWMDEYPWTDDTPWTD